MSGVIFLLKHIIEVAKLHDVGVVFLLTIASLAFHLSLRFLLNKSPCAAVLWRAHHPGNLLEILALSRHFTLLNLPEAHVAQVRVLLEVAAFEADPLQSVRPEFHRDVVAVVSA